LLVALWLNDQQAKDCKNGWVDDGVYGGKYRGGHVGTQNTQQPLTVAIPGLVTSKKAFRVGSCLSSTKDAQSGTWLLLIVPVMKGAGLLACKKRR